MPDHSENLNIFVKYFHKSMNYPVSTPNKSLFTNSLSLSCPSWWLDQHWVQADVQLMFLLPEFSSRVFPDFFARFGLAAEIGGLAGGGGSQLIQCWRWSRRRSCSSSPAYYAVWRGRARDQHSCWCRFRGRCRRWGTSSATTRPLVTPRRRTWTHILPTYLPTYLDLPTHLGR